MGDILLCFYCHDLSTAMQHDLYGSFIRSGHLDLTWGQIFKLAFHGQNAYFDVTWREEGALNEGVLRFTLPVLDKEVFVKKKRQSD